MKRLFIALLCASAWGQTSLPLMGVGSKSGNANGYTKGAIFTFNVHPASNLSAFPNLVIGINGNGTFPPFAQFADVAHAALPPGGPVGGSRR